MKKYNKNNITQRIQHGNIQHGKIQHKTFVFFHFFFIYDFRLVFYFVD